MEFFANNWFNILWSVVFLPLMLWLSADILRDMSDEDDGDKKRRFFFTKAENRLAIKKYGPKAFRVAAILCVPTGLATVYYNVLYSLTLSSLWALIILVVCMIWLYLKIKKENAA